MLNNKKRVRKDENKSYLLYNKEDFVIKLIIPRSPWDTQVFITDIKERFSLIFKVYYQNSKEQVPVRENTQSLYIESENEEEVRKKLKDRDINIEYITKLEKEILNYEKQSEHFKLESI